MQYTKNTPLKLRLMGFTHAETTPGLDVMQKGAIEVTINHATRQVITNLIISPDNRIRCSCIQNLRLLDRMVNPKTKSQGKKPISRREPSLARQTKITNP